MLSVEKVYDELYGMIEDLKKQIAATAGSDVTITPALESGTKVADYSIDGESGSLYSPTPFSFAIGSTPQLLGTWDGKEYYAVLYKDITTTKDAFVTVDADFAGRAVKYAAIPTNLPEGTTSELTNLSGVLYETVKTSSSGLQYYWNSTVAITSYNTIDLYVEYVVEPEPEEAKSTRSTKKK